MEVPFFDLKRQNMYLKKEIMVAIEDVINNGMFIGGETVSKLEEEVAKLCGVPYAVAVSSGTDALLASLMVEGIGPGDEVITTTFTFFATAGCISRVGAKPVFVDINPDTYNIDYVEIEKAITDKTKAIIPVHLFGQCADMAEINEIADKYNIFVIEDAAQAIGADYLYFNEFVTKAGSMGHYGCFSFFPTKNLGAFGDGGMIVTKDYRRMEELKKIRNHGSKPKYYHKKVGGNFRLDAIQAAILLVKIKYLDEWTKKRQIHAKVYKELLSKLYFIETPFARFEDQIENYHIYNQYVIKVPFRDALQEFLKTKGISTEVYYPLPLHQQDCFSYLNYKPVELPVSFEASFHVLALPIFPELRVEEQQYIVDKIFEFYRKKGM